MVTAMRLFCLLGSVFAFALAACAHAPVGTDPARPAVAEPAPTVESIFVSAGVCFGFCPDFDVTVRPDGRITFVGRHFSALQGTHELPANPALFEALQRLTISPRLPWPKGDVTPGLPTCPQVATDLPSYAFRVNGSAPRGFSYYAGCFGPEGERAGAIVQEALRVLTEFGVPTQGVEPPPMLAPEPAVVAAPRLVIFSASPCRGFCPDYTVTVDAEGGVLFEGRQHTRLRGSHQLGPDEELFSQLAQVVVEAPWPQGDVTFGSGSCRPTISDLPDTRLVVEDALGASRGFSFNPGCGGAEADRARALVSQVQAILTAHGVPIESAPSGRTRP